MTPHQILQQYWGYSQFRPLQEDIIQSVLSGKDTLALLPTGGGKSVCFQVPALALEGVCLVVTPLIALMKDQVHNLKKRNIPAEAVYSGMNVFEVERAFDNCMHGKTKFLYLSPERLGTKLFLARLPNLQVSIVAIDEAHCISQWGYDFRPAYLKIAQIRTQLPHIPFLALTATATARVKADIQEKLKFGKNAAVFQKSFTRSNLSYSVLREENKIQKLTTIFKSVPGCGIVYVRSRKETAQIAEALKKQGISSDFYHAGLDPRTRSQKQDAWVKDKIRVMACTNAFGMGIDKPDVRTVVHLDLPESVEAYYQEAGRAGRDEQKAYAVLLFNNEDIGSLREQFERNFPPIATVRKVYHLLGNFFQVAIGAGEGQSFDFDMNKFLETNPMPAADLFYALKVLEENNYLQATDAVFLPSRVMVRVTNEQLYDVQLRNPRLEPYIKVLLRSYGGVFDQHTEIYENVLAKNLKTSTQYVQNALTVLHKNQVIDYIPQTDKPQLIFTQPRAAAEALVFDVKLINFRKKVRQDNLQAVIAYAQNNLLCRSRQLVAYFGELDSLPCGVCDVCLQQKKLQLAENRIERISAAIKKQLRANAHSSHELVAQLTDFKEDEIIKVLRWLTDNHQILFKDGTFRLNP